MYNQFRNIELKKKLKLQEPKLIPSLPPKTIARGKLYYQPKAQLIEKQYYSKQKDNTFKTSSTQVTNLNTGKTLYHANLIFEKKRIEQQTNAWIGTRKLHYNQSREIKKQLNEEVEDHPQTVSTADTEEIIDRRVKIDAIQNTQGPEAIIDLKLDSVINKYLMNKDIIPPNSSIEEYVKIKSELSKQRRMKLSEQQRKKLKKLEDQKFPTLIIKQQYEELAQLIDSMDIAKEIDPKYIEMIKDSKELHYSYMTELRKANQLEGVILSQGESFIMKWLSFNYEVLKPIRKSRMFNHFSYDQAYNVIKLNQIQQLIFKLEKKILKKVNQFTGRRKIEVSTEKQEIQQQNKQIKQEETEKEESDELLEILLQDLENITQYEKEVNQEGNKNFILPHKELTVIQGQDLFSSKDGILRKLPDEERIYYRKRITNEL